MFEYFAKWPNGLGKNPNGLVSAVDGTGVIQTDSNIAGTGRRISMVFAAVVRNRVMVWKGSRLRKYRCGRVM